MEKTMAKHKHLRSVLKNPEGSLWWSCGKCGKELCRLDGLLRHNANVHGAPYTRLNRKKHIGYPTSKGPAR
jgi:hypothetical protein